MACLLSDNEMRETWHVCCQINLFSLDLATDLAEVVVIALVTDALGYM